MKKNNIKIKQFTIYKMRSEILIDNYKRKEQAHLQQSKKLQF